jgi:hypothetical protein
MKNPDNHEELSLMLLAKWELEDELKAVEDILSDSRMLNVNRKKEHLHKNNPIKDIEPKRRTKETLEFPIPVKQS